MLPAFFLFGLALAATAPTPAPLRSSVDQPSEDPVADGREVIATLILRLAELSEKRDAQALEALAVIERFGEHFPKSGPKDKRDLVEALARLFETRKAARDKEAASDPLHLAATDTLGAMGPQSVSALIRLVGQPNLRGDLELRRRLLVASGKTRDKKAIDTLVDHLTAKEDTLVAAAGEALSSFERADQATRKRIFEEILKTLAAAKSNADRTVHEQGTSAEPQPSAQGSTLTERYETIRAPLSTALSRLSNHAEGDPDAWQRWWNKNKKADWDDAD